MKTLHVSKIQLSNAADTVFMNMTYKNEPVLPKLVNDIMHLITISVWTQKGVLYHEYILKFKGKTNDDSFGWIIT